MKLINGGEGEGEGDFLEKNKRGAVYSGPKIRCLTGF